MAGSNLNPFEAMADEIVRHHTTLVIVVRRVATDNNSWLEEVRQPRTRSVRVAGQKPWRVRATACAQPHASVVLRPADTLTRAGRVAERSVTW